MGGADDGGGGSMSKQWWTLTGLVARREINDRGRAKSFWIASVLLIIAVAAAAAIPALVQGGGKSTARIGIVGNTPALTQAAREAGQIAGTDVAVVSLPDVAAADAQLRAGALTAAAHLSGPARRAHARRRDRSGADSPVHGEVGAAHAGRARAATASRASARAHVRVL